MTYSAVRADRLYKLLGLAVALDISETGVRVRTSEPLPLGEELGFNLKIGEQIYRVHGRIVWGSETDEDRCYEFGVRFKMMDFGLAKDLWMITERALEKGAAKAAGPEDQVEVEKLVSTLAKKLGAEAPSALGASEREVLRRIVTALTEVTTESGRLKVPATESENPTPAAHDTPVVDAVASPSKDGGETRDLLFSVEAAARTKTTRIFREKVPTPKPQGMVGHFEGDQLIEFVQMLGVQAKTGVLEVSSDDRSHGGHLAFRDGLVIAARTLEDARGEAAAHEILAIGKGHFDFWPHRLSSVAAEHSFTVQGLLLELLRRRDEPAP